MSVCVINAAVDVDSDDLGSVDDPELEAQYANEARRMRSTHEPVDVI